MAKKKKKKQEPGAKPSGAKAVAGSEPSPNQPDEAAAPPDDGRFEWKRLLREPIAIGLGLMFLYRPWRDGMTYVHFNVYFMLWITLLACGYTVWKIRAKEALRFPVPTVLFGGFIVIAYLTALVGVDYDVGLRNFLFFASYFLLFFLVTDGVRTRLGIGILVGAVALTSLVNAVWAVVHTEFVLPYVRESIGRNPQMLEVYFNDSSLSPELKNRLEMQRAFGTFLHPNSLAGYLALVGPMALFWGLASLPGTRGVADAEKPAGGVLNSNFATLLVGALSGFAMLVYMYGLNVLLEGHTNSEVNLIQGTARSVFFYGCLPVAFGMVSGYLVHMKGTLGFGRILATLLLFLGALVQMYTLWLTFSRGAMLGVIFSSLVGGVLIVLALRRIPPLRKMAQGWAEFATASVLVASVLLVPTSQALEVTDEGFQLPNTVRDWRPKNITYSAEDLEVGGRDVEVNDIASGRSLEFRLSYWSVSMLIVKDNFFTGVGLGNFGEVYGYYQYLDAHDVKTAHNDYLQMLTDTGILGFLFFMAFWIYVLVWGAGQVLREQSWPDRLRMLGLYLGVLAFLAHTFFDFNMQNPTLSMTLYLLTALMFSLSAIGMTPQTAQAATTPWRKLVGVPACVFILVFGVSTLYADVRQFRYDFGRTMGSTGERLYQIGNGVVVAQPLRVLESILGPRVLNPVPGAKPVYHTVGELRTLITNDEDLARLGAVQVPAEGGGWRRPNPGEAYPENAVVVLNNPQRAREIGLKYGVPMLERFDRLEEIYPHGTHVPAYAYRWCKALAAASQDPNARLRFGEAALQWSKRRAERSPYSPEAQIEYCGGMWERGKVDSSQKQLDYYREGAAQYKKALELFPTSQSMYQQYGEAMQQIGQAFIDAGEQGKQMGSPLGQQLIEEGQQFKKDAEEAFERATWLARYKHDVLQLR